MTAQVKARTRDNSQKGEPGLAAWLKIGLRTALISIVAVLLVQALALSIWPAAADFKPLDSYARSAIFTLVPALAATAFFAWLFRRSKNPVPRFLTVSAVILLLSFIPDFILPDPNRTLLGSSIAATLHLVAAITTIGGIILGYRAEMKRM